MGYKELMNYDMNKARKEAEVKFYEETDINELKIALYHGTDRFVLDLNENKRKQYVEAIKVYLSAAKELSIDFSLSREEESDALLRFDRIKSGSSNYEYGALYTTASLYKMGLYAKTGRFVGECGYIAYYLHKYAERNQIEIDMDLENKSILNSLFAEIERRKPEPVYLKFYGLDKIDSMEDGSEFNKKQGVRLIREYCNGTAQESYRMMDCISLADFVEIDSKIENMQMNENAKRVKDKLENYTLEFFSEKFGLSENEKRKLAKIIQRAI